MYIKTVVVAAELTWQFAYQLLGHLTSEHFKISEQSGQRHRKCAGQVGHRGDFGAFDHLHTEIEVL